MESARAGGRAKSLSGRVSGAEAQFQCLCGAHVAQTGRRINGVTQTDRRPRREGRMEGGMEGGEWSQRVDLGETEEDPRFLSLSPCLRAKFST